MTDLARRQTVTELVAVYERSCADIREGFALVSGAVRMLNDSLANGTTGRFYASDGYCRYPDFDRVDNVLEQLKRQTWRYLVERLELSRFLSVERANQLSKQLEHDALPDITVESVMAFADGYMSAMPEMLTEAVAEVFEWLRPRHGRASELKTNSQFEVPQKVIVWAVERGYGNEHFRISYHREANVTALENVFTALDGRGQVTRCYRSDLSNAVKASGPDGKGETRYFRFRACKNGHLHITFKRSDLLAKFNRMVGAYDDDGDGLVAVKIGRTEGSSESRIQSLQTGCPFELRLIASFEGGSEEESALHSAFAEWRMRGEWFLPSRSVLTVARLRPSAEADASMPAPPVSTDSAPMDSALASSEKAMLLDALARSNGVKKRAAELLGISFRSIRYRIDKHGIGTEQD